jgi:hypothetical protein
MDGYTNIGSWNPLKLGSSIATVEKESTSSTITLYADAIKKTATWSSGAVVLKPKSFCAYFTLPSSSGGDRTWATAVNGTLYFKNLNNLASGVYANYSNDRIVFYDDDYRGKDFTAFVRLRCCCLVQTYILTS